MNVLYSIGYTRRKSNETRWFTNVLHVYCDPVDTPEDHRHDISSHTGDWISEIYPKCRQFTIDPCLQHNKGIPSVDKVLSAIILGHTRRHPYTIYRAPITPSHIHTLVLQELADKRAHRRGPIFQTLRPVSQEVSVDQYWLASFIWSHIKPGGWAAGSLGGWGPGGGLLYMYIIIYEAFFVVHNWQYYQSVCCL